MGLEGLRFEIEVLGGSVVLAELGGFGKSGKRVLAGDAGQRHGAFDQAIQALTGKVRGRRAGGAKSNEDAQADGA